MCLCACAEDANWHPGKCFVSALRCIELAEIEQLWDLRDLQLIQVPLICRNSKNTSQVGLC